MLKQPTDKTSTKIEECYTAEACPGWTESGGLCDGLPRNTTKWPDCSCGYAGPLCAECDAGYFLGTFSKRECRKCGETNAHGPTIFIAAVAIGAAAIGAGAAIAPRQRIVNGFRYQAARYMYRMGRVKARVIFFALQTLSEFVLISEKVAGRGGAFAEPAATFARMLGITNLDVFGFIPLGCVVNDSTFSFYTKLLVKVVGPIVPLVLLWARPLTNFTGGARRDHSVRFAAKWSLVWLELVLPSVTTTIVETYVCRRFDNGELFLNAMLTIPCDGSHRRRSWVLFASLAAAIYPLGVPLLFFSLMCLNRDQIKPVLQMLQDHRAATSVTRDGLTGLAHDEARRL